MPIVYLHSDPVQQAVNIAIAINAQLNGAVVATSQDTVVTITSAASQYDSSNDRNEIVLYSEAPSLVVSGEGFLSGGTPYIGENNGEFIPAGTVFTVAGDTCKYIITENCVGGHLYFSPPAKLDWQTDQSVTLGVTIVESAHASFTVTEDCTGSLLKFTPALDTMWLRNTMFSWARDYIPYEDSANGSLYFLPPAISEWPIGTELYFGVSINSTIPTACDRSFAACISYGNEKRYCGFPTTGGRSITI